jgi:zinc protease
MTRAWHARLRWIACASALASPQPLIAQDGGDSSTTSYQVAGVRVIHRRVASNEIVAANLYLLGGTRQITFADAGIEPFLLVSSERGTTRYSREDLRRALARTGSSVVVDADADWTVFGLRTTASGFADTWPAFADRLVSPRLADADVAAVRDQLLASLAQRRDSPDAWAEHLADSVAFAGHPYGVDPLGNARSVASLTSARLHAYHREQFVKSRMLLVVVGNVARPVLDSLITVSIGTLPAGDYRWVLPDTLPRRPGAVHREARALPTNYLVGYAPGPRADSPDYDALRVASAVVSGSLFSEVRSRLGLTYAVAAPFRERAVSAIGLYVSTTEPDAAMRAMRAEVTALQQRLVERESLTPVVQQFITEFFLEAETNAAQAGLLARSELYQGDWRRGSELMRSLRAVSPADIQRVLRTYLRDLSFAYVGDPSRLSDASVSAWR